MLKNKNYKKFPFIYRLREYIKNQFNNEKNILSTKQYLFGLIITIMMVVLLCLTLYFFFLLICGLCIPESFIINNNHIGTTNYFDDIYSITSTIFISFLLFLFLKSVIYSILFEFKCYKNENNFKLHSKLHYLLTEYRKELLKNPIEYKGRILIFNDLIYLYITDKYENDLLFDSFLYTKNELCVLDYIGMNTLKNKIIKSYLKNFDINVYFIDDKNDSSKYLQISIGRNYNNESWLINKDKK
jgi:hypothetical protein